VPKGDCLFALPDGNAITGVVGAIRPVR
jgi:hypothetical protein